MPEMAYGSMPVPGTPIGELRRWRLEIRCSRCRRQVVLELGTLTQRYDQRTRIVEIVRRLRCRGPLGDDRCGGTPSRVVPAEIHVYGKSVRKVREVTVLGGK